MRLALHRIACAGIRGLGSRLGAPYCSARMFRESLLPPACHVPVKGGRLAFEHAGGSRVPLVVVHGFMGSRLDFVDVRVQLARHRRVLFLDHRGHGESSWGGGPYTISGLMRDLEEALDHLGEEEVDLLGHSMGGMVALRWALSRPGRVRSLVLSSTTAGSFGIEGIPEPSGGPRWLFEAKGRIREQLGRDGVARMAESLDVSEPVRARFAWLHRLSHRRVDPEAAWSLARDMGTLTSVEEDLDQLKVPTLVMCGDADADADFVEPSRALYDRIPDAKFELIEGAGHFPHVERPEAWCRAVEAHLARASDHLAAAS